MTILAEQPRLYPGPTYELNYTISEGSSIPQMLGNLVLDLGLTDWMLKQTMAGLPEKHRDNSNLPLSIDVIANAGQVHSATLNEPSTPKLRLFPSNQWGKNDLPGAKRELPAALDPDLCENGFVQYKLMPAFIDDSSESIPFQLSITPRPRNRTQIELVLQRPLDREVRDSYDLFVVAMDQSRTEPRRTGTLNIRVMVEDVNDCRPIFDLGDLIDRGGACVPGTEAYRPTMHIRVPENKGPVPWLLKHLRAYDADSGANGKVHFELGSRTHQLTRKYFRLNSTSGELWVVELLDREKTPLLDGVHRLVVLALDSGTPVRSSQLLILVYLLDENDNAPRIRIMGEDVQTTQNSIQTEQLNELSQQFWVNQEKVSSLWPDDPQWPVDLRLVGVHSPGQVVATLVASDLDRGANGTVDCRVGHQWPRSEKRSSDEWIGGGWFKLNPLLMYNDAGSVSSTRQSAESINHSLEPRSTGKYWNQTQEKSYTLEALKITASYETQMPHQASELIYRLPMDRNKKDVIKLFTVNAESGQVILLRDDTTNYHSNGKYTLKLQVRLISQEAEGNLTDSIDLFVHIQFTPRADLVLYFTPIEDGRFHLDNSSVIHLDVPENAPIGSFLNPISIVYCSTVGPQACQMELRNAGLSTLQSSVLSKEFCIQELPNSEWFSQTGQKGVPYAIITKSELDREAQAEYRLRLFVYKSPDSIDAVHARTLIIQVTDVNDNGPVLMDPFYPVTRWPPSMLLCTVPYPKMSHEQADNPIFVTNISMSFQEQQGYPIFHIQALDRDAGEHGSLTYSLDYVFRCVDGKAMQLKVFEGVKLESTSGLLHVASQMSISSVAT
ncbi:unnamed protein product [Echinostoma caproni]|uniref:Cadherin domain-containing protein n=1 Tax=Echinostoma caproni TaxID=27848 RepID=A0A183A5T7_9TREM|nr:unnamed protein product [Echinostoma caproni]